MIKKDGLVKKILTVYLALTVFIIFSAPGGASALAITKENVIDLTNKTRVERDAPHLVEHPALTKAAQNKADDMITRQYWAHFHNGKKPWDWMEEAGYNYIQAGENLAIDFVDASKMNEAWLESKSHRENMLNKNYQHIGIGIASGWFKDHDTIIVVQMFGKSNQEVKNEDQDNDRVFSADFEVNADQPDITYQEKEDKSLTGKLKNILVGIGENFITTYRAVGEATNNSMAWIGDRIFDSYQVFAD